LKKNESVIVFIKMPDTTLVLFFVRRIKIKNVSTAARCSFHHYKKKAMFFSYKNHYLS